MAKKGAKKKKGVGFVSILLFVLAIVCFAYGAIVLSFFRSHSWFNYIWFMLGAALLILSFLLSGNSGLPGVLKGLLGIIILACVVNFGMYAYKAVSLAAKQPPETADWVIVLGAKVNGTEPSTEFAARINKAVEYSAVRIGKEVIQEDSHKLRVIATGGQGEDEGAAEADVCARILRDHGIPMMRIFIDKTSTTTKENLENSAEIILANGGSLNDKVLIVSSGFHLYRASKLASALGYTNAEYMGSTGLPVLVPHYIVREYAANIKENMLGNFGIDGGFFEKAFNGLF